MYDHEERQTVLDLCYTFLLSAVNEAQWLSSSEDS